MKTTINLLTLAAAYGIVLPYLVSARNTELTIAGVLGTVLLTGYVAKSIIKKLKEAN